jgi:hypothetical protein
MIKKLLVLSLATSLTACVTTEPVKISPYDISVNATQDELYNAAVDCSLENISAPTTSGQFFDYQDKESGRLSVAFESSYIVGLSSVPLKSTMSIVAKKGKVIIKFNSLMQHFESVGWVNVYQESDGSKSDAEAVVEEFKQTMSECIKASI